MEATFQQRPTKPRKRRIKDGSSLKYMGTGKSRPSGNEELKETNSSISSLFFFCDPLSEDKFQLHNRGKYRE